MPRVDPRAVPKDPINAPSMANMAMILSLDAPIAFSIPMSLVFSKTVTMSGFLNAHFNKLYAGNLTSIAMLVTFNR